MSNTRDNSLGAFLKSARERISPKQFGIKKGRRRTPGLRREEVAQLSDISTTWYTWLEQGRTTSVSGHLLARLAKTLKLSNAERHYLFKLANQLDKDEITKLSPELKQHLLMLTETVSAPTYVMDRHWDLVAWNDECKKLFDGWLTTDKSKNLLRFLFLDPLAKTLISDWQQRAERLVAEYRADSVDWHYDKVHLALVDELSALSEEFKSAWNEQHVLPREGGKRGFFQYGIQRFYEQFTLRIADNLDMKMVILRPINESD
ncbi:helix-turn-helix transcriptional regulator [Methylophaga sulfidovorans]|uniref:Helix-turn-helix domain-containing protein n=1 Tax=Methylophaga sulfidovorans TaxID=45496 RepID=A0A1I4BW45_9GAMM|nr:helix-turn-helix transcriptional regulator [Methylophaga sulfidovorans]SFK73044.1 Helix-turn-helix domain-containing protein [Methylophaga sulfidovorans]